MKKLLYLISLTLLFLTTASSAEESVELEDLQDAPPPPSVVESGEELEPEVTIINKKDETIEEYRINGNLYMIKVTPAFGPSYYLIDNDGDGVMDTNMSEIYSDFVVPQWVIFSW